VIFSAQTRRWVRRKRWNSTGRYRPRARTREAAERSNDQQPTSKCSGKGAADGHRVCTQMCCCASSAAGAVKPRNRTSSVTLLETASRCRRRAGNTSTSQRVRRAAIWA